MNKNLAILGWGTVALLGAAAVGVVAVHRGEPINALWLVVAASCCYALGYRFYSKFIAVKILALDGLRATPAERLENGRDFLVTNKWVVFGHHFAAIAGPGPLVGPVLAAQFGYLPGTLWVLAGAVFAGCVQDFVILLFSVRRDGKSLTEMAKDEIGRVGGFVAYVAVICDSDHLIGCGGADRGERAEGESMGDVHDCDDHADRAADGLVFAADSSGESAGSVGAGICSGAGGDLGRAVCITESGAGASVYVYRAYAGDSDHGLRVCGFGAAGVAAAGAARLSQHVREAGNDCVAGGGNCGAASHAAHAGADAVYRWHRSGVCGEDIPFCFYHDCLRSDQRISCADLERNHSEADCARDGDAHGGLRRDDVRIGSGDHGDYCGLRDAAGDLFRH